MSRLDEVISKYATMQDKSEEGERQKRRARLPQATSSHSADPPKAFLDSGEVWKGYTLQRPCSLSTLASRESRVTGGGVDRGNTEPDPLG